MYRTDMFPKFHCVVKYSFNTVVLFFFFFKTKLQIKCAKLYLSRINYHVATQLIILLGLLVILRLSNILPFFKLSVIFVKPIACIASAPICIFVPCRAANVTCLARLCLGSRGLRPLAPSSMRRLFCA